MAKRKVVTISVVVLCCIALTAAAWLARGFYDRLFEPAGAPAVKLTYPLLTDETLQLPDTLQFFYSTIECRGTALSTGEFYVKIKYPVLRLARSTARRYEDWLLGQVFILGTNAETEEVEAFRQSRDIAGYAQSCLNSWQAGAETRYMGCLQESLAVEIELNASLLSLKVSHGGYWGGAHGDASVQHYMFDQDFRALDPDAVFAAGTVEGFRKLLIAEFDKQVDPPRDYGEHYKLNPDSFALVPQGLVAHYFGWSNAEGKPVVFIEASKIRQYLKPAYREIYANQARANPDPEK